MGQGELCINYLIWALSRLSENSILLIEEPESHLPPRAQNALMNYIAEASIDRSLSVVVSTHSQHTLENFAAANITLLTREGINFVLNHKPVRTLLHESLRIVNLTPTIIITEDNSAGAFLKYLIFHLDESLLELVDIGWANGWTDLDEILKRFPSELKKIHIRLVYDGDQRGIDRPNVNFPFHYLPDADDPAKLMADAVKANIAKFSESFPADTQRVRSALAIQAQTDAKDYFHNVVRALGEIADLKTVYKVATLVWLSIPENKIKAEKFLADLSKSLEI
ncbi:AAA family ATPase [Undibacterium terreum]|nr:AAA family ATPase [Undibacterium terreum]